MGVITFAVCKTCKVKRDLDKFYSTIMDCESRGQALKVQERIERSDSFRSGLLATFMNKHYGHDCTLYRDSDWVPEIEAMPEDYDFWTRWQHTD